MLRFIENNPHLKSFILIFVFFTIMWSFYLWPWIFVLCVSLLFAAIPWTLFSGEL